MNRNGHTTPNNGHTNSAQNRTVFGTATTPAMSGLDHSQHANRTSRSTPRSVIIGLDVSERRIGYAVLEYDSGQPLATGTLHTPAGEDLHARVKAWSEISATANQTGDIQLVVIEAPWSGPNKQRNMQHALAIGNVAGAAAARLGPSILVDTIQPATWRSLCNLPTRGKEPVHQWATRVLNRNIDQDQADALGIATAAHQIAWKGHL